MNNDSGKVNGESPGPLGMFFSRIGRRAYSFLASVKLALALLVIILTSCLVGVAGFPQEQARALVFSTIWFNGLLVLLTVNVACCFFPRMRRRKLTPISLGMILFHLSFVAILIGIICNSLFYFRGSIRLTEGEVLPSGSPASYDTVEAGPFFYYGWLKGETALIKMYSSYKVGGADKQAAYEISVGEGRTKKRGVIYITNSLSHDGFGYYNNKEGYSILIILYDKQGKERYGAYVPLQSLKQKDETYLYTTGTKYSAGSIPIPYDLEKALFRLQLIYHPNPAKKRSGDVDFRIWTLGKTDSLLTEGKAPVGKKILLGGYSLEAREVRYWVGMNVFFEPGKPIVLASLCVGLAGMVITTIGRLRKKQS